MGPTLSCDRDWNIRHIIHFLRFSIVVRSSNILLSVLEKDKIKRGNE